MTSVRSRLALSLAFVLIIPALVVVGVVGFAAPRAARQGVELSMQQAATAGFSALEQRCGTFDAVASGVAVQVQTPGLDQALTAAAARRDAGFVAVVKGGQVVSSQGALPSGVTGTQLLALGCTGPGTDPAPAAAGGALVLARVVTARDAADAPVASVVVGDTFTGATLKTLGASVGMPKGTRLAVRCPNGDAVASSPEVPGAPASDAAVGTALINVAARGAGTTEVAGWQVVTYQSGGGCAVAAAVEQRASPITGGAAALFLVLGLVVALALVVRLADSLTRPILALTEAAERVALGDLTTRLPGGGGSGELDRLSGAFNHMTDELQTKLGELESSRDLLRENVGRLGDTLQRTHDLDGLLMTVLGAAASATVAHRATVWLVEGGSVVARVSSPAGAPRPTTRRVALGTDLAGAVAADGVPRRVVDSQGDSTTGLDGPALCAPLRRGINVLGVIVVEREPHQPPFAPDDEAMLVSLAGPAGIAVDNVMLHREAQRLSVTDPLTGAGNLRHMTTTLAREVERATRFGRPLSLLLLDLDFFKNVNDTYGHTVGDAVLRELARRLAACVREVDTVARYGGEEFVVVTPETDIAGAERLAARICEAVREEAFVVGKDVVTVTVSVGIAALPMHGSASGDLVRSADEGLYAAKRAGRDQYQVAPSGETAPTGDVTADR